MYFNSKLSTTNYLLEKGLDVETVRRKVISNNLANIDVPHFKRSEVNFESELKRVIHENAQTDNRYKGITTEERHIPFYVKRYETSVKPRVNLDYSTRYNNNGNNVDIDVEMAHAAKNLMRYNAFVSGLNHNFKMMKISMRTV